jgi:sulfate adenylyltransferase subunit 2
VKLKELIEKSIFILREAKAQFNNLAVLWSTGKDSTVMLDLCRKAFFGNIPFPVIHIDTGYKFDEIYEFRDKINKLWNLNLKIIKDPESGILNPNNVGHFECCHRLKTLTLKKFIEKENIDGLIVSIRRDEHYMRMVERVFSPRDKDFRWKHLKIKKEKSGDSPFIYEQDAELWNIYRKDFVNGHIRIHPLLHWTELDIWKYIQKENLPVNPLYFANYVEKKYGWKNKRFRSLGCKLCTKPVDSSASSIEEIIKELEKTDVPERSGRCQDKEREQIMRRLRSLGYL